MVPFEPTPRGTCKPVGKCYYLVAVEKSIGVWSNKQSQKIINLTQLRRSKRTRQKPGRKKPRLDDCNVIAAPHADDKEMGIDSGIPKVTNFLQMLTRR